MGGNNHGKYIVVTGGRTEGAEPAVHEPNHMFYVCAFLKQLTCAIFCEVS